MVENFGLYLKHERELRGVALEEIAETTKIHIRFLEALENNDFDNMPGEVFVKGYIRSYAKVIGFDSEEMVNAYDESVGKDRREEIEKVQVINEKFLSRKKAMAGYVFGGIALVVIFSLGYLIVENIINESKIERVERLPAGEPSSFENPSTSAPTNSIPEATRAESNKQEATGAEPEPPVEPSEPEGDKKAVSETPIESAVTEKISDLSEKPVIIQQVIENPALLGATDQSLPEPDAKSLHLKIEVQGNSWFNLTVDDSKEEDFILPGGSTKNIYGREKIRLTIGNRNGTHLFLNGQPIDMPSGSSNEIRDFDITANLLE